MQQSNLTCLPSGHTSSASKHEYCRTVSKAFPALLIHITFCNEIVGYQTKPAESKLSLVNLHLLVLNTFLAFICSEADSERPRHIIFLRQSLSCSACTSLDPLSNLKEAHCITCLPQELPVTFLYNSLSQMMVTCLTTSCQLFHHHLGNPIAWNGKLSALNVLEPIAPPVLAGPLFPQQCWYAQSWGQALLMKTKGKLFQLTASHPPTGCPSHLTSV